MESLKVDEEQKVLEQKEIEKFCEPYDSLSVWGKELCRELGPNALAVLARIAEKYKLEGGNRKLWVPKWEDVTLMAKRRRNDSR